MVRVSTYLNFPRSTEEAFWGGYFGSLADRYAIHWMFNCANKV